MGRFDLTKFRYLTREELRVLHAVELGMRNHELVPKPLLAQIAKMKHGSLHKVVGELIKARLLGYDNTKSRNGYRLSTLGYDYLALKTFTTRDVLSSVGSRIGVGKESDIYIAAGPNEEQYAMKLHRLGRTSFRNIKNKRDYHRHRNSASWLYLSRLSAVKEFAYMKALYDNGYPVPQPIDFNRHAVIMELMDSFPLCQVKEVVDVPKLYGELMSLIVRLAEMGLIHGDFNEFNLMVNEAGDVTVIDFPQMVSIDHENAEMYFDRDVACIRAFFSKRFAFEASEWPRLSDVERRKTLDIDVEASGFDRKLQSEFVQAFGDSLCEKTSENNGAEGDNDDGDDDDDADDDDGDQSSNSVEQEDGEDGSDAELTADGKAITASQRGDEGEDEDGGEGEGEGEGDVARLGNKERLAFRNEDRTIIPSHKRSGKGAGSRKKGSTTGSDGATQSKGAVNLTPEEIRARVAQGLGRSKYKKVNIRKQKNKDAKVRDMKNTARGKNEW